MKNDKDSYLMSQNKRSSGIGQNHRNVPDKGLTFVYSSNRKAARCLGHHEKVREYLEPGRTKGRAGSREILCAWEELGFYSKDQRKPLESFHQNSTGTQILFIKHHSGR